MMQCPECGATTETADDACPDCGTATCSPTPRESRATVRRARRARGCFALALTGLFLVVFVAALLLPTGPPSTPHPSNVPTQSVEPTRAPVNPDRAAVEAAIHGFYSTVDAGESVTVSPYVYSRGGGGVTPAQVEPTGTTTFAIARAVVGSRTADVYGRESRDVIATEHAEVEFRLRLVDGDWLISSWQVSREATIVPEALGLSNSTARDIVGTLLRARQVGDATTLRMLVTDRFRLEHDSWFDGEDKSALLSSYRVLNSQPDGEAYAVTVAEQWKPTPLTTTYTVIISDGEILVDSWSWK